MAGASLIFDIMGRDKGVAKMFEDVAKKAGGLGPVFEGAGALVGKLAGPLVAIGAGVGIKKFVDQSVKSFDDLAAGVNGLKRVMGGSTEQVSAMRGAMQLAGVNVDEVGGTIQKFAKSLGGADASAAASQKMMQTLGFNFKDAAGNVKPMTELLPQLADRFKTMPDGAEKTALAMQLFGKQGTTMIPFLNKGSAGIAELEGKAKKMGLTLDDVSIKIMAAGKGSARDFAASVQGMKVQLGQDIAPLMTATQNITRAAVGPILNAITGVFASMRGPMLAFAGVIQAHADKVGAAVTGMIGKVHSAVDFLKAGFTMPKLEFGAIGKDIDPVIAAGYHVHTVFQAVVGPVRAFFAAFKAGGDDITSSGIAGKFEAFGLKARAAFDMAKLAGQVLFDGIRTGANNAEGGIYGFAGTIGNAIHHAFSDAREAVGLFFAGLKSGTAGEGSSAVVGMAGSFGAALHNIVSAIGPVLPSILQLWQSLSPVSLIFHALLPVLPQLAGLLGQLGATLATSLGAALTTIMPALQGVAAALVGALAQVLPIALAALGQLLPVVVQAFMGLIPVLLQIVGAVVPFVTTLLPPLLGLFAQLVPVVLQVVQAVIPLAVGILSTLLPAVAGLVQILAAVLIPVITSLLPVVTIVFGAAAQIIMGALQIVTGIIQVFSGLLTGDWSMVWNGILSIFSGIWQTIVAVVSGVVGVLGAVIGGGLQFVAGLVGSILGGIGGFFAGAWSNIIGGASGFIGQLLGFFESLPGQIGGLLAGAGSWLYSAGQNIIDGLINGVQSMMGAIGNAILSLVPGPIVGVFKDALGIHSPSRVFHELGKNIPQGLIGGITEMVPAVEDRLATLVAPSVQAPAVTAAPAAAGGQGQAGAAGTGGPGFATGPGPGLHIENITVHEAQGGSWRNMGNSILQAAQVQAPRVFA